MKKHIYLLAIVAFIFTSPPAHAGFMDFMRGLFEPPTVIAPPEEIPPVAPAVIDAPITREGIETIDRKTITRAPRVAPMDSIDRDTVMTPPSTPVETESDHVAGGEDTSVDTLSPSQAWAATFPLCSFRPALATSSCYLKDYCHCTNFIPPAAAGPLGEMITDATPRYQWTVVGQRCDEAIPAESQPLIGIWNARAAAAGPFEGFSNTGDDPLQINIQRLGRTFQEACTARHGTTSERSSDCESTPVDCPFSPPIKCRVPQGVSMRASQLSLSPMIAYDYDGTAGGTPRVIDTYSETAFVIGGMVILNDNPELVRCLAPHLSPGLSTRDMMSVAPYLNPAPDPRRGSSYLEALAW